MEPGAGYGRSRSVASRSVAEEAPEEEDEEFEAGDIESRSIEVGHMCRWAKHVCIRNHHGLLHGMAMAPADIPSIL